MQVVVDRTRCRTHGQCCFVAPEVFDIDDDGVMQCIERPDESQRKAVEDAVFGCPEMALSLVEDDA
jgi:ferredoxin